MRIAYPDVNRDLLIKNLPFTGGFFIPAINQYRNVSKQKSL
jgi:hypothetical protein